MLGVVLVPPFPFCSYDGTYKCALRVLRMCVGFEVGLRLLMLRATWHSRMAVLVAPWVSILPWVSIPLHGQAPPSVGEHPTHV